MGLAVSVTASESKSGKMEQSTRASGRTTRRMGRAPSGMQMVTSTKANSAMTSQMATASFTAPMGPYMKVSGKMISNTDQVKHTGLMALAILATTRRAGATVSVPTNGPTVILIVASGRTML